MSYDLPPVVLPVDNSSLAAGMNEAASIVSGGVAKINQALRGLQSPARGTNAAMAGLGFAYANPSSLSAHGFQGNLNAMRLMQRDTDRLGVSLDRIGKQFTGGLGIGATVGGFALVERVLDKAINKAKEFQTATLSIAATMSSLGTRTDRLTGKALDPKATFEINLREAENIRRQILSRSARTILTFQEQMGAFESSLNPGTRKGFSPQQTMDLSERSAIVAKTLGLRGEQISNASRLLLGGGVNVARSTIGRALGIQNSDIAGRYGDQLYRFLDDRLKGFTQAQDEFAGSIEGILSTIESRVDTMLAMAGERFFKNPKVKTTLGKMLQGVEKPERKEGESAEEFSSRLQEWEKDASELNEAIDSLADLFSKLFNAISQLAKSPEAKVFQQFLMDVAQYADKIVLGAVFLKIAGAIGSATSALRAFGMQMTEIASGNLAGGLLAAAPAGTMINRVAGPAMAMANRGGVPGASIATGAGIMGGQATSAENGIIAKLAMLRAGQRFDTVLTKSEQAMLQKAAPNTPLGRLAQNIWGLDSDIAGVNNAAASKTTALNREKFQVQASTAERLAKNERFRAARIAQIEALRQKELDEAYKQVKAQGTFGSNRNAFMNAWDAIMLGNPNASLTREAFKPDDLDAYKARQAEINARHDEAVRLANARANAKAHGINLPGQRRLGEIDAALLQTELGRAGDVANLVKNGMGTAYIPQISPQERFDTLMGQRRDLEAEQADLVKRQRLQKSGITRKDGELLSEFGHRNQQVLGFQRQRLLDIAEELAANRTDIYDTEGLTGRAAAQRQLVTGVPALNNLRSRIGEGLTNTGMRLQNYGGIALAGGMASYELNGLARNNDNPLTRGLQFLGSGVIGGVSAGGIMGGVPGAIAGGVIGLLKGSLDIATSSISDLAKQADAAGKALEDMRSKLPASTQRYLDLRDKARAARGEAADQRTATQKAVDEEGAKYLISPTAIMTGLKTLFMPFAARDERMREAEEVGKRSLEAQKRAADLDTQAAKARVKASEITNERLERSERASQTIANADAEIKRLNEGVQNMRTQEELRQQQVRKRKAQIEKGEADRTLMNGVDYFVEQRLKGTKFDSKGPLSEADQKEYEVRRKELVALYDEKAARIKQRQLAEVDDVADIERRSSKLQYRGQLAQMTGNGPLAGVLNAFAQATEMTKNIDKDKRPAFMREVVTAQARELSKSLRADIMQRDQVALAMQQFPENARIAMRNRELEGRALGLEGKKLRLDAEQLDLGDKRLELTARRMALVVPQLDLRAEQLNLDSAKLSLDIQNSQIQAGRNAKNFSDLMNPAREGFAAFEDRNRAFQAQMSLRQAQRGLTSAMDAPTMFYGGLGPVSNIAAQLRYRVEAQYAKRFNPAEYEAAYGRQIESQLANMGDEQLLAQNRVEAAKIEIAKNELALQSATEALQKAREDAAQAMKGDALNAQAQLLAQKGQGIAVQELGIARGEAGLDAQALALQRKGQGLSREELAQRQAQYGLKVDQYDLAGPELIQKLVQQVVQLRDQYDTLNQQIGDKSKAGAALQGEAAALNVPVDVSIGGLTREDIEQQLPSVIRKAIEDFCRMKGRVPGN